MGTTKLVELFNPATTAIRVAGPDGRIITVAAKAKTILPEYFTKYAPSKLRLVRYIAPNEQRTKRRAVRQQKVRQKPNYKKNVVQTNKPVTENINRRIQKQRSMRGGGSNKTRSVRGSRNRHRIGRSSIWRSRTVGRADNAKSQEKYVEVAAKSQVPISTPN